MQIMKNRLIAFTIGWLCLMPLASGAGAASFSPASDSPATAGPAGSFTLDSKTQIPGRTLGPGAYTIQIVDRLSDRMIVQVDRNGKKQSTFLALPATKLRGQGPIALTGGAKGKAALRGFAFPNGIVAEFVYPKSEAVGLAKANDTTIPAIDPESEGRVPAPDLSRNDLQEVTLWMLSPTLVGPGNAKPGIQAVRYQQPRQTAPRQQYASSQQPDSQSQPALQTQARPPAYQNAPSRQSTQNSSQESSNEQQVAANHTPARPAARPAMTALPHTASSLPLIALTCLFSFSGALWLNRRRRAVTA